MKAARPRKPIWLSAPSLLDGDTDVDLPNDTLTVNTTPVAGPSYGLLTLNANGTFCYTHDGSENFTDSFTYEVLDADGGVTDTGTVTITITPVNDAPVAVDDSYTVNEGSTTNLNLAANDTDADDGLDLTSITIVSGPSNGSLVVNADGTVDYTHDGSETVADNFTYTLNDASGATSTVGTVNSDHRSGQRRAHPQRPGCAEHIRHYALDLLQPEWQQHHGRRSGCQWSARGSHAQCIEWHLESGRDQRAEFQCRRWQLATLRMTFTGTAADINAALNGLSFQADADYEGMATVQIITDDLGNVGTGGALNALDRVNITVDCQRPDR